MQDDLVDDSIVADNDIVQDRSLTAHKKQPSKDKEKEKAEEAVDKDKAGAEERDEDNAEDTHFSLARRAKKATAGGSGEEEGRLEGLTEAEVEELLSKASEESIFYSLACRFEDTKAEADQTFIVHGESLLLHCLNDPLLAWSPATAPVGGQYLHVIYAMESELARLSEGGRQCRVVWLDSFTDILCAGRTDLLVLTHIVRRHTGQQCGVLQDVFTDWWSDDFRQFLERVDPAFLIVGDAHAHAYERGGGGGEVADVSVLMRGLTLSLLSHNFRCVRMNEMRTGANGIVAFQYQMPVEYQHKLRQQPVIPSLSPLPAQQRKRLQDTFAAAQSSSALPWSKVVSSLPSLPPASPNSRLALTVYAVGQLLTAKSANADSVELAKLLILQAVLLGALPLSSRALLDEKLTDQVNSPPSILSSLLPTYFDSIASVFLTASAASSINNDSTLLDLFDLRLLLALRTHIRSASAIGLTRQQADVLNQCWSLAAGAVTGLSKDWLPLYGVKELAPEVDVETAEEEEARKEKDAQANEQPQQQQEQKTAPTAANTAAAEEKATKPKKTVKISEAWDDEDEAEEEEEEKEVKQQQPAKRATATAKKRSSGGQWDDEDADEVVQDEVVDDWEALAEEEPTPTQQAKPTSTNAKAQPTTSATSPVSSTPLVQPISIIQHSLLDTLTKEVNTSLAAASALVPLTPPPLPPTAITPAAELDVAFLGEEIKEEGDILRDKKAMRQHQRQINFMTKYSKSLGGGKIVQREVIVKDKKKDDSDKEKADKDREDSKKAGKAGKPGAGGGKKSGASGGSKAVKLSVAEQIKAEGLARQRQKEADKVTRSIQFAANLRDLPSRIESLDAASEAYSDDIVVPALMQLLEWQLAWWKEVKSDKAHGGSMVEAVKVWTIVHDVYRRFKQHLKLAELQSLQRALILLGFDDTASQLVSDYVASMGGASLGSEKELRVEPRTVKGVREHTVSMSAARFQMEHGGPYMLRNVASSADERVDFYPDAWQARLLDVVDARHSALLVAPTSSGKTFISYYCMKQTLKENAAALRTKDRRVIVYVAPNKALVNQVSGDIYRRFGDVFGVMTSDWQYRVLTCDVLITVPTSLEALLLDPARSEWVATIRYVIFDEVHLIGSEEGLIWERCIQICQHAPFLALSATVGNAESFHDWLARCQAYHQRPVHLIQHTQRWADLEKYAYVPQKEAPIMSAPNASFQLSDMHGYVSTLSQQQQLASVIRVHPCAAITNVADLQEANSFPPELAFSPKDSLSLYDAMKAAASKLPASSPLIASLNALDPERYFASLTINKSDAMEYERAIKNQLSTFIQAGQAPLVASVLTSLSTDLRSRLSSLHSLFPSPDDAYDVAYQMRHFVPLLVELNAREHLPAIVFCHDQLLCNQLVIHVVEELERMQDEKRREERTDESERARLREREKQAKALRRLRDKQKNRQEQEELQREGASTTTAAVEDEEDVYDVDVRFSFLKQGEAMDMTEMEWWVSRMLWKTGWKRSHPLVRMLFRGIGVHHGALVKPYRDAVETLFRAKHLKVVVATQTLALGINMPARSVVFCGDSKLLTPLQYRQMSGRAGRRGFDLVGHVVFFAIPPRKMFRLLKSPLLSLRGQYPVNTSFALRTLLFTQGVKDQQLPFSLFPSLVQQSFFAHSHPSPYISQQIMYHFRYACQLLFQQSALNERGRAHGLAGFIAHLHAAEPSNLILAMLLLDGQLQTITNRFKLDKNGVARQLLFILAHLFQRVPMPQYLASTTQHGKTAGETAAESTETDNVRVGEGAGAEKFSFILDPLPSEVQKVVDTYNRMTVDWAVQYLAAYATLVLDNKSKRPTTSQPTIATPAVSSPEAATTLQQPTASAVNEKEKDRDSKKGGKAVQGKKGGKDKDKAATASAAPASTEESDNSSSPASSTLVVPPLPDVTQPAPVDVSLPPVYVESFVLPRSGLPFPHAFNSPASSLAHTLIHPSTPTPIVRSPFVSLSGATDTFHESDELLRSVRNGAIIESSGLPTLDTSLPLNSYIVDFYRHGDIDALIGENGIPRNRVFDLLKRFDLMLSGLIRALGLLGLGEASLLWRAFQHMQLQYHELFAKLALQH